MTHTNRNVPNINNSKSIGQVEIENARKNMNSTARQDTILGAKVVSNTLNGSIQENMTNSVPNLNSSLTVGSKELQNAKNKVQNSGSRKGMF